MKYSIFQYYFNNNDFHMFFTYNIPLKRWDAINKKLFIHAFLGEEL